MKSLGTSALGRDRRAASSFRSRVWACRVIQTGSVVVILVKFLPCTRIVVRGGQEKRAAPDDSGATQGVVGGGVAAGLLDLAAGSAQRVELAQGLGLLAGGDLLGKQSAGHRAVRQSPHPVAAGDVDAA